MRKLLFIFLALALWLRADVVPAASVADWSQTGGYALGIPDTSGWTVVTAATAGLVGDSTNGTDGTDNQTTWQNWINGLAANSTTILQMGTGGYRVTGQLQITGKQLLIKGNGSVAGVKNTKIYHNTAAENNLFYNFRGSTSNSAINISSGYTKGSTSLVFASSGAISTIAVGDWIWVSQTNDSSIPVTPTGSGSSATYCGVPGSSGTRLIVQLVQVMAKNSATLTINRGLYWGMDASFTPQILEFALQNGSGFEDLYMYRTGGAAGADVKCNLVSFDWVYNGWVKNCELDHMAGGGVCLTNTYGVVVRDNYIHDARDTTSGNGYAIWLFALNSDAFIFNNVAINCRHNFIPEGSAAGCVFAYNYGDGATSSEDTAFMFGATDTHAGNPFVNLFEGISDTKLAHDNTIGSSNRNTSFRSHYRGQGTVRTFTNGLAACVIEENSHENNVVACVLGLSGQTGNQFAADGQDTNQRSDCRWGFPSTGTPFTITDPNVAATTVVNGTYGYCTGAIFSTNASGLTSPDAITSLLYSSRPSWATTWFPFYDPHYPNQAVTTDAFIPKFYEVSNSGASYPDYTPTALATGSVTTSSIPLTWNDNSTGETGYAIYRSTDGGSTYSEYATTSAGATSYTVTGLLPATAYYFKVAAYLGSTFTTTPFSASANATTSSGSNPTAGILGNVTLKGSATIK